MQTTKALLEIAKQNFTVAFHENLTTTQCHSNMIRVMSAYSWIRLVFNNTACISAVLQHTYVWFHSIYDINKQTKNL